MSYPAFTAEPLEFEEAIAWFKSQFPLTEELAKQLGEYAGRRAFVISGVAHLDMVFTVYAALLKAIETGESLSSFKRSVGPLLRKEWGSRTSNRVDLLFRNTMQKALNRGRYLQLKHPDVARARPYWMFDAILDSRTSPVCTNSHGYVAEHTDGWWRSHYPPLHHRCRSSVRSLTASQAKKRLGKLPPTETPSSGFGDAPDVEQEWTPKPDSYPPELWAIYKSKTNP